MTKEEFKKALIGLGVKISWANEANKASEMFDALDMAANGTILRYLSTKDLGEAVF